MCDGGGETLPPSSLKTEYHFLGVTQEFHPPDCTRVPHWRQGEVVLAVLSDITLTFLGLVFMESQQGRKEKIRQA